MQVGLIAQENVKIPMYAPMGKAGTMGTQLDQRTWGRSTWRSMPP